MTKINSKKASSEIFERALNTPLSDVSRGLLSEKAYVNYQKRKLLWTLIHDFMNLIQRCEISQDIWEKIFPVSSIFHKSYFPLRFCVGCCLSFQRVMCRQHVFYIQITGIAISI